MFEADIVIEKVFGLKAHFKWAVIDVELFAVSKVQHQGRCLEFIRRLEGTDKCETAARIVQHQRKVLTAIIIAPAKLKVAEPLRLPLEATLEVGDNAPVCFTGYGCTVDVGTVGFDEELALAQSVNGNRLAFLDSAASSQLPASVIEAVAHYQSHDHSNVGSLPDADGGDGEGGSEGSRRRQVLRDGGGKRGTVHRGVHSAQEGEEVVLHKEGELHCLDGREKNNINCGF